MGKGNNQLVGQIAEGEENEQLSGMVKDGRVKRKQESR